MRGDTRVTVAVSRLLEAFGKRGRGASGTLSRGLGTSADRVVGVLWLLRSLEAGGDTGLGRWRCLGQSGYCPLCSSLGFRSLLHVRVRQGVIAN